MQQGGIVQRKQRLKIMLDSDKKWGENAQKQRGMDENQSHIAGIQTEQPEGTFDGASKYHRAAERSGFVQQACSTDRERQ